MTRIARRMRGTLKGMAVAALIAAQASPGPALAEVRLSGEAGANYQIAVKSWWEIPFRSVVRQQYDFSCGSAAVATLLTYHYGRRTPEQFAFAKMWESGDQALIRKSGFSMLDMKNLLNSIGYKAEGFRMSYKALRAHRQPGIVLLDLRGYKHFVVVKGVTDKSVLVGDPMIGLSQYSHEDFAKIWNGIFLAVVAPPTSTPAKFNLASDWGPWATAPLEEGGLHVAVGDLTNNLPFGYQLSSQLLYDVRTGTISQ